VGGWGYYLKLLINEETMPGFLPSFFTYLNATHAFAVLKDYVQATTSTKRTLEAFIDFLVNHELVKDKKEQIVNYLSYIKTGNKPASQ